GPGCAHHHRRQEGKLADLSGDAFVTLNFAVDQRTVRVIDAKGPPICDCGGSLVKSVDALKGTLTVDDRTYAVAKQASIVIDGKQAKLADLSAGAKVGNLLLCVDQKTVASISANGK